MSTIRVNTDKPYNVVVNQGCIDALPEIFMSEYAQSKVMIVTDNTVAALYGISLNSKLLSRGISSYIYAVAVGENSKSLANYTLILEELSKLKFTRTDIIIALGGGVVGDLAGFVAATYMRGVRLIQVPTTLLAAIDSSVGGKTAINLGGVKNVVGAFYQPTACYIDSNLLHTLPHDMMMSGMGEAAKYAILEGGEISDMLLTNTIDIDRLIELSVLAKARYVVADEYDKGMRMMLNLGHTYGHAIEADSNYSVPHGIAVARGLRYSLDISRRLSLFKGDTRLIDRLIATVIGEEDLQYARLNKWIEMDKKAEGKAINIVAISNIAQCELVKLTIDELRRVTE